MYEILKRLKCNVNLLKSKCKKKGSSGQKDGSSVECISWRFCSWYPQLDVSQSPVSEDLTLTWPLLPICVAHIYIQAYTHHTFHPGIWESFVRLFKNVYQIHIYINQVNIQLVICLLDLFFCQSYKDNNVLSIIVLNKPVAYIVYSGKHYRNIDSVTEGLSLLNSFISSYNIRTLSSKLDEAF